MELAFSVSGAEIVVVGPWKNIDRVLGVGYLIGHPQMSIGLFPSEKKMEDILNKLELISALQKQADLSKTEAAKVVDLIFENMADVLARGVRVEIRGLCSFHVKEYEGYTGINPKTGAKVAIKPKKLPFFKVGRELKERVNL